MTRQVILLFGAQGQLGVELARSLSVLGTVLEANRANCDFTNPNAVINIIRDEKPALIVNAAAYTAVDKAESESGLAFRVNAETPAEMAIEAARLGCPLIHYSTDYVYDGVSKIPYREDQQPAPLGVYGKSKLAGDEAIISSGCPYLILRTSWVYGHTGQNFFKTIIRLARTRSELKIVNDQIGAPTWARLLAYATGLAAQKAQLNGWKNSGIYHVSAGGSTSWFEFANDILLLAQSEGLIQGPLAQLSPITAAEYGAPATRPPYSVLSNQKLLENFGIQLPDWRVSFIQFLSEAAAACFGQGEAR